MKDRKLILDGIGLWSLLCLLTILLITTLFARTNYPQIVNNIVNLATGNLSKISSGAEISLMPMAIEIIAVVLIGIAAALLTAVIFSRNSKSYDRELLEAVLAKGPWLIFLVVAAEELFARGLFLGLLTKIFPGTVAFYVLFFLGNALWAALHLSNFKSTEERNILRVLPQFVGGVAFTYIFIRFGIFAAILAHYFYDVVVMVTIKKKSEGTVNLVNAVYYLIAVVILFFIARGQNIQLSSLTPWLTDHMIPLDGYNFWDYVIILLFVSCVLSLVANVLFLDSTDKGDSYTKIANTRGIGFILTMVLLAIFTVAFVLLGNWLVGIFVANVVTRAIVLTILLSLMSSTSSGSALARATLVNLPIVFLVVVAFTVLGFWTAVGIALAGNLVDFIPNYLESVS